MKYYLFPLLLILIAIDFSFSQDKSPTETYYKLFDSYFNYKNYEVFNGLEYVDEFPELIRTKETNNKFYDSYDFIKGLIVYNGEPYYNLEIKYDLFNDHVLLKYLNKKINYLKLNSKMVSQFRLKEDKFVRLKNNLALNNFYRNGFFKEGYKGERFSLYVKYKKNKQEDLNQGRVVYIFEEYKFFFVCYMGALHRINSKKDMLKAFPFREKEIRTFYKNNSSLLKSSKEHFFIRLVKYLDTLNHINTNE
ncbi:hypothetical protein [Flavivirga algicola]|uniref:DUF4105 domain-containing protein n=1 Tax=Flavivirga algicola TaxID=2729136 RepID=A0ABX1RU51_9FLAO|nr:hypothetical protein [Flavivirga algicola]NMH87076.1 hypothetical protein [Flavivirga algicola]